MVRFSYVQLPDYPLVDSIDYIRKADELGFYAAYSVDETYHKDPWLLFAAAADKTKQIRMGPNVTHLILRDPTLVAQMLATLDELTGGRAEAAVSFGNLGMLSQYNIEWKGSRPLARVREGFDVIRTFLKDGAITHDGEFFRYSGLFTFARPVQDPIPLKIGAMGGPRSFELAGEIADGMHHALGYSRQNYDYVMKHVRIGAEKAGRNVGRSRSRGVGGLGVRRGLGRSQGGGPDHGRLLPVVDAAEPARTARHRAGRPGCHPRRLRRRAGRQGDRAVLAPRSPSGCRWPARRRSAWPSSRPTSSRPASTT